MDNNKHGYFQREHVLLCSFTSWSDWMFVHNKEEVSAYLPETTRIGNDVT